MIQSSSGPMSNNLLIDVQALNFSYAEKPVLENISMKVHTGESVSLIGASGCGKSTLLNLISGSLTGYQGTVRKKGLWRRVYQSQALLPWMTVEENIRLGKRGRSPSQCLEFDQLIQTLDLKHVLSLYPRQLSGGLRQRTEIARALIGQPDGLLLDEPFSSLDYLIRREIIHHLKELISMYQIAVILVTHDIPEALSITSTCHIMTGRPAKFFQTYSSHQQPHEVLTEKIWQDIKSERSQNA